MKTIHILFLIIIKSLLSKHSKKEKALLKKPSIMGDKIYCAACYIVINSIVEQIAKVKSELTRDDLMFIISDAYLKKKNDYFKSKKAFYEEELLEACRVFSNIWDDRLEKYFLKFRSKERSEYFNDLCLNTTYACDGVWNENEIEKKMMIEVNEERNDL